jgi:hypothetical protein
MKTTLEQFNAKIIHEPNTGCWLWTRSWCTKDGYGKICGFGDGSSQLAHRWSYEHFKGPIPEGLVIDHLCRTPACVNPDHLEAVTQQVNVLRGVAPSALANARGTCTRGHPSLHRSASGYTKCLVCDGLRRGIVRGPHEALKCGPKPKSHCGRGHPFSGDNLYVTPGGKRSCRACNNANQRAWQKARRCV